MFSTKRMIKELRGELAELRKELADRQVVESEHRRPISRREERQVMIDQIGKSPVICLAELEEKIDLLAERLGVEFDNPGVTLTELREEEDNV